MRCAGCGSIAPDLASMVHSPSCKSAALFPSAPVARRPYERPTVTPEGYIGVPSADIPLSVKVYWLLRAGSDASGINWYEPQRLLRAVQREVELALDTETRAKLAASGFEVRGEAESPEHDPPWMQDPPTPRNTGTPQVCSCVNPPRLGIGETSCPGCGGSRAT